MLRHVIDFLYPRTCLGCMRLLASAEVDLCGACRSTIERVDPGSIQACVNRMELLAGGVILDLVSLYVYREESPLRPLIHALKYRGFSSVGTRLGRELGETVLERRLDADLVVAIPLSRRKQRERGFNQASRIAEGVSQVTGIRRVEGPVVRLRHTESQTALTHEQRRQNVLHAFGVSSEGARRVAGQRCLLVDDVITTGATVLACAKAMREAGAADIVACSVAVAR